MAKVAMAIASTTGKKIKGSIAPKKKRQKSRLRIADESKQLGKSTDNSDEIK
jgi:hypothetical protein